jgi:hypothetical protein
MIFAKGAVKDSAIMQRTIHHRKSEEKNATYLEEEQSTE